jgi:demethylmenaquinone methyltransferase/2-methoxy-6-polyprenyl-1,4-benzoquinol methylase
MQLDEVARSYDRAAKHYDALSDLIFDKLLRLERYRERTVELLGDVAGATVLDVGCGTGLNFPLLVRAVGRSGRVIGLDYSAGMLHEARTRVRRLGLRNVSLVRGDAVTLAGIAGPVDCLASVWCYGNVYDIGAALDRAVDVVRPGGSIAIMVFVRPHPDTGPLRWVYPVYRTIAERAGVDAAEHLDDAKMRAKWQRGRERLLARLGTLHEEPYLHGMGIIAASRKRGAACAPAGRPAAVAAAPESEPLRALHGSVF